MHAIRQRALKTILEARRFTPTFWACLYLERAHRAQLTLRPIPHILSSLEILGQGDELLSYNGLSSAAVAEGLGTP